MVARTAVPSRALNVPRHVAIIMDGNGRWAAQQSLPRIAGHQAGIKPVRATVEQCAAHGVDVLTLFAFSSENWRRPPEEVRGLMRLFLEALQAEVAELDRNGIRLRFIGDLAKLAPELTEAVWDAERRTAANHGLELIVAVAYGGRWDIVQAARRLAREAKAGRLSPEAIDEAAVAGALDTRSLPEVDLLIRTGGEKRISNFLLWDLAYAELCFSDVLWPDFDDAELRRAFEFYAERQRRFGQTADQLEVTHC